ncbi:DUF4007 family protein [Lamprobacter modestohalophilus]|uniref:DUF4007 family protein n=1 Tax=Lamprobacter modestohalophilus TaxID=1064514 RepID=UPI002ADEBCCA|nr:DUF4007 family protein [Lamprobacter modestohalophilus]MEA1052167.1 DUF4007 family protein [Lamprobacter modestohalophilus]
MKLDRSKSAFGRHATFPLRYAWLTKGFRAMERNLRIFSEPERAMIELGVGRNMVTAIQYWLQVTRIADFTGESPRITLLGRALLDDHWGDPYLEDEATLWILHWLIVSNPARATGFYWFFNRFATPYFREPELRQALTDFAALELRGRSSQSTIKSDCSTLLRMYAPAQGRGEDHLDTPFAHLGLIEPEPNRGFRSARAARPFLPPLALHFALADRFHAEPKNPALPMRELLEGGGDWPAVGAAFRLSEDGLMAALAKLVDRYPGYYELRDTAGVHQLYCTTPIEPHHVLRLHYQKETA